jgi:hypothetical protein
MTVVNQSDETVCRLYFHPTEPGSPVAWGENLLAGDMIAPDDEYRLNNFVPGRYHFKAEGCGGTLLEWAADLEFTNVAYIQALSSQTFVTVVNASSEALCSFTYGPSNNQTEVNLISADLPVEPGETRRVETAPSLTWSLSVASCSGQSNSLTGFFPERGTSTEWIITDESLAAGGELPIEEN